MTHSELQGNERALKHAVAQQRLEGLVVPQETLDDLDRVARGEMTTAEALQNAFIRFSAHA